MKLDCWVSEALLATKVASQKKYFIIISSFDIKRLMIIKTRCCQIKFEVKRGSGSRSNTYDAPCILNFKTTWSEFQKPSQTAAE